MEYIKIDKLNGCKKKISIPIKTEQKQGYESVCEITGTAIPSYFEYKIKGHMSIFERIPKINITTDCPFTEINELEKDEDDIDINKINLQTMSEKELLYIANRWSSYKSGYIFKLYQINNYDWLSKENLEKCMKRLGALNISEKAEFEKRFVLENRSELLDRKIIGYIDCIDGDNIYEFKCVNKLENENYLQLAIYMYLHKFVTGCETGHYYLYNILTDELDEIKCDNISLKNMMEFLIYNKYIGNKKVQDNVFIKNMNMIIKRYKKI